MEDTGINKKIFTAVSKVGIASAAVYAINVARYMIIAGMFGVSSDMDMFLIAIMLPQFVLSVTSNTFQTVIIPSFIRERRNGNTNENIIIKSILLNTITILIIVSLILLTTFPSLLKILAPSLSPEESKHTVTLFQVFLPTLLFGGISVVLTGILNVYEKFTLPSLLPGIITISGIIFILTLGNKIGLISLSAGMSLGSIIECLVAGWYLKKIMKVSIKNSLISQITSSENIQIIQETTDEPVISPIQPRHQILREKSQFRSSSNRILYNYAILGIGTLSFGLLPIIDRSMASSFGVGSVSALEYGSRIIVLALALSGAALRTGIFPYLVQIENNPAMLLRTFKTYSRLLTLLSVTVTILFFFGSELLVRILFERGAFKQCDSEYVALVQRFYALQIPFYLLGTLGTRILSAWMKFGWISTIAVMDVCIKIILNNYLISYIGISGIAFSTSIMHAVSCLLIYLAIYIKFKAITKQ